MHIASNAAFKILKIAQSKRTTARRDNKTRPAIVGGERKPGGWLGGTVGPSSGAGRAGRV